MALKHFAIMFLFAPLFSSLHDIEARDSLMFNKIPNKVNEDNNKYLSNNYNTEAYVTQPENINAYTNTPPNNNNYQPQDNDNNFYNAQEKENNNDLDFMGTDDTSVNANNMNSNYNNDFVTKNNLNTEFMDASEATNNKDDEDNDKYKFMDDASYDINYGQYVRDKFGNSMYRYRFKPTGYNNVDNSVQYTNYKNEDNMP
ncbi:hypothetical protein LIER_39782 [Lithospermum erythrorhizon]|uniref:Protein E6 n=1 Tax=Lithospermum erythrorhizon TaxID=34254 RepID=A0AAV3QPC8_LITER